MLKYLLLTALLALYGCSSDPLVVETSDTDETATSDGLASLDMADDAADWTTEDGVLTATAPASLTLLPTHGALTVAFSFRTDADTRATLMLGGEHALTLPALDLDTMAVKRTTVDVTPGVWQNLEIAYLPADGTDPPLLVAAYLNNNLVYYQQPLSVTGGAAEGPLTLDLEAGSLSLTNVRTLDRAGRSSTLASNGDVELNLPLIRYAYYDIEGSPKDVIDFDGRTPAKEGYISRFDIDAIREARTAYAINFTSDLDIPKAGEYTFRLRSSAISRLYLDDELVVDMGAGHEGIERRETVSLGEGSHRLRLTYYQTGSWNWLKLQAGPAGQEELPSLNDIPEDRAVAVLNSGDPEPVEMDDRPYLLRSFLNFPPSRIYDYTDKRTHVISVGESDGPHYSYDLRNGSLLQVWRGPFADVSQMWVERGEPQVMQALGPVVAFDGRPQWSDATDRWPQENEGFRHLRYELDDAGRPTFYFGTEEGGELSDRVVPTAGGLQRTLTNRTEGETLYTTVVAASAIRETGPGTFELVDPGLNVHVDELATGGLRLLRGQGVQRLVAELPPGEHLTYSFDW
ncbi:PA14 domain-containing protein [Lewinella sp. IMCC34183]|uniref:PA14 domain-containing protein n=1 Tax=Lewinella sp. IMCC34183 TaxID=2248762 RepID=UPI000E22C5AC|nr:PA14 domain-containing protein [Lewinella sp. IMCC34183]